EEALLQIDAKTVTPKMCIHEISNYKNHMIPPEKVLEKVYRDIYTEYQSELIKNNAMDFDDLLINSVKLFKENPMALDYYTRRFKYIMVDEYQDTNQPQFELVKLLAGRKESDGSCPHNICVVGDDDQSIYKFRGADVRNILNFEHVYNDCKVIRLEQNYRSTKNILSVANEVIKNNKQRKEKTLWTSNTEGDPVSVITYFDDRAEAAGVADIIKQQLEAGYKYSDIAILYRTNAQSLLFEKTLKLEGIPAKVIGSLSFFARKEIKDIVAYLKTIDNGMDDISTKRIINVPARGIGSTTIDKLSSFAHKDGVSLFEAINDPVNITALKASGKKVEAFSNLISELRNLATADVSIKNLIEFILAKTDYAGELERSDPETFEERLQNIQELLSFAVRYEEESEENGEQSSLTGFLEFCSLSSEEIADERANADENFDNENYVSMMTLHSSKGLEFPIVFMCGMEEGLFPSGINYDDAFMDEGDNSEIEEDRRLCYVGITRAMKRLYMTKANQRMRNGNINSNKPSRFIYEIPRYLITIVNTCQTNSYKNSSNFAYSDVRSATKNNKVSSFSFEDDDNSISNKANYSEDTAKNTFGKYSSMITKGFGETKKEKMDLNVGDRVRNIRFGEGVITDIQENDKGAWITVNFDNFGVKKLLAELAKLQKM
ncbi:MAG: UvrD-helicase domain-containing protein, partial [Lachnospiraceae bacterium]|nr:UvrD-helicase domain-containing protein [Lachnospiraceae bacterium]